MELSPLGLLLALILCSYSGHAAEEETSKAVLVLDPDQTQFYRGESVTLRCSIEGQDTSGWSFFWQKDSRDNYPQQGWSDKNEYTLQPLDVFHSGEYTCQGLKDNREQSKQSEKVKLQLSALPTATVTVEPESSVFVGERVTLKCEIQPESDWTYKWFKGSSSDHLSQPDTSTLSITAAAKSDESHYWCQGEMRGRAVSSLMSGSLYVFVKALPTAAVTVESPEGPYYPGDEVTLRCDIAEYTDWYWYYWRRGNDNIPNQNKQSITIAHPDQAGQYQYTCEGSRQNRPKTSQHSTPVSVSVRAFPVPTLTVQPSPVFTGETVTLTCGIQPSSGWTYQWNILGSIKPSETNTYIISRATVSDQGEYWCYGVRERSRKSTYYSSTVQFTVNELPLATLTVEPQSPVFTGENVTLKCVIESLSGWTYKWYKESSRTPVSEGNTFTIRGAAESHKGQYWCQGERRHRHTSSQPSRRTTIDVKDSKPKLTLTPGHQLLKEDSVTLRCELGVSSDLVFYWYRNTQTSDPLNQTDGNSYSISSVKVSDGGQYWCRAGRGDPVFYTQYSDAAEIKFTDAGSSTLVVAVGVVMGLLVAFALVILLVLLYRSKKAKGSDSVTPNLGPQQSNSHSTTSQNRVFGGAVAGTGDVVYAEIELKDTDEKKKEAKRRATMSNTLYSLLRPVKSPVSDGGGDRSSDVTYAKPKKHKKQDSAGPSDVTYADVPIKMKPLGSRANQPQEHLYSAVKPGCSSSKE